jgi:hypothetical protein
MVSIIIPTKIVVAVSISVIVPIMTVTIVPVTVAVVPVLNQIMGSHAEKHLHWNMTT